MTGMLILRTFAELRDHFRETQRLLLERAKKVGSSQPKLAEELTILAEAWGRAAVTTELSQGYVLEMEAKKKAST